MIFWMHKDEQQQRKKLLEMMKWKDNQKSSKIKDNESIVWWAWARTAKKT